MRGREFSIVTWPAILLHQTKAVESSEPSWVKECRVANTTLKKLVALCAGDSPREEFRRQVGAAGTPTWIISDLTSEKSGAATLSEREAVDHLLVPGELGELARDCDGASGSSDTVQIGSSGSAGGISQAPPLTDVLGSRLGTSLSEGADTPLINEDIASAMSVESHESPKSLVERFLSTQTSVDSTFVDASLEAVGSRVVAAGSSSDSSGDGITAPDLTSSGCTDGLRAARRFASLHETLQKCLLAEKGHESVFSTLTHQSLPTSVIDMLLEERMAQKLPPSHYALHRAILARDYLLLYLLLRSRYRHLLNVRDPCGRTALHVALLTADPTALQMLFAMPRSPLGGLESSEECEDSSDVDFPSLGAVYNGLSVFHLPLARADWPENLDDVLATYAILISFWELVHALRNREQEKKVDAETVPLVLRSACGWSEGQDTLWALEKLATWSRAAEAYARIDARDFCGASALHRASNLGLADAVQLLLAAGASPRVKDHNGDLPLHKAVDSGDPDTFALLLRRGGAALVMGGHEESDRGCDPSAEDTSILVLFRRCILRGSWRCLGRLVMDEVYSQFPIPETALDSLLEFAGLCGYNYEFSESFKMAVDGTEPLEDGSWRKEAMIHAGGSPASGVRIFTDNRTLLHLPVTIDDDAKSDNIDMRLLKLQHRYPENPHRLHCLTPVGKGILRGRSFQQVTWDERAAPIDLADLLRVHEWSYVSTLLERSRKIDSATSNWKSQKAHSSLSSSESSAHTPVLMEELDSDTSMTRGSWDAALAAAGCVVGAVEAVCSRRIRQAFCAVRPPGHHVGLWGPAQAAGSLSMGRDTVFPLIHDANEDFAYGSQGFCLLNNVAVGAAYARYHFARAGIKRIAIVDFDVHHGNGTEQIVMNLKPRRRNLAFAASADRKDLQLTVQMQTDFCKMWLNESDTDEIFFASIHGYGDRFYPGTGGRDWSEDYPNIRNVLLESGLSREEFRHRFVTHIVLPLKDFEPDLIMVSAGFDAHQQDGVSMGFGVCSEYDYFWMTRHLVAIANGCCDGRIVSVLEGGYNSRGGCLSPLAQSVAYHVKGFLLTPFGLGSTAARLLDSVASSTATGLALPISQNTEEDSKDGDCGDEDYSGGVSFAMGGPHPALDSLMSTQANKRGGAARSPSVVDMSTQLSEARAPVKRRRRAAAARALAIIEADAGRRLLAHRGMVFEGIEPP